MSARPVGTWFLVVAGVAVAGALVAALAVIGSPAHQRAQRFDERRVAELVALDEAVARYASLEKRLPEDLAAVQRMLPDRALDQADPETARPYGYRALDARRYVLCATFATARSKDDDGGGFGLPRDAWLHPAGPHCFTRTLPAPGPAPTDTAPDATLPAGRNDG